MTIATTPSIPIPRLRSCGPWVYTVFRLATDSQAASQPRGPPGLDYAPAWSRAGLARNVELVNVCLRNGSWPAGEFVLVQEDAHLLVREALRNWAPQIGFNAATLVAAYGGDGVGLRPLCTVLDLLGRGIITVVPRDVTGGRHKAGSAAGGSSTRSGKATSRLERLPWLPASATPPTPSPREDEPKGEAPEPARPAPLPQPTMNWHAVAASSSQPKREVRRRASARRSRGERFLPTARPQK